MRVLELLEWLGSAAEPQRMKTYFVLCLRRIGMGRTHD